MIVTSSKELGKLIRNKRKALNLTQVECAGISGVGVRFLSDLENGKATCEIGKSILILNGLGLKLNVGSEHE
ncbi:MAG: helix-turn-helix domain-containing protein [Marinicella sp.]